MHTQPELWTRNAHGDYAPTLAAAQAAGAVAMESVEANAEANTPGFKARARAFILAYLAEHGPSSSETINDMARKQPWAKGVKDGRAFGGSYLKLANDELIRKVDHCKRRHGHGSSGGTIWGLVG